MSFPYRIASDRGSSFLILGPDGEERLVAISLLDQRPAVGDYVSLDAADRIIALAPRRGVLARARSDRGNLAQIIATHLDRVFVVTAPGREFSVSRVERYLMAARAGGIAPIVVLNKCDLAPDAATLHGQLVAVAGDAPVHALCAVDGAGCDALAPYLTPATTLALVGSSGVGKSTLANRLLGDERFATGATRASDGRGKHTTTTRELIALTSGAWLIDTPGMRGFAPWADDAALDDVFADITEAARRCRFRDCAHAGEPGCAVSVEIDDGRVARYHALRRELAYLDRRDDPAALAGEKQRWKQLSKGQRAQRRR